MKRIVVIVLISVLLTSLFMSGSSGASYAMGRENVIIVFKESVGPEDVKYLEALGGVIKYTYTIINGVAVDLPQAAADRLRGLVGQPEASGDPVASRISYIEHDGVMYALADEAAAGDRPATAVQPAVEPQHALSLQESIIKTVAEVPKAVLKLPLGDMYAFPVLPLASM